MKDRYRLMGYVYDLVGTIYSAGLIPRCKIAMIDRIAPGDKVLFAGAGHGKDAIQAAKAGARVTVVDLSATMLQQLGKNVQGHSFSHPIRKLHRDILDINEYEAYDFVFANFFLNVFPEKLMIQILEHLSHLVKPNGHVIVGDFVLPQGGAVARLFQKLHWFLAVLPFYLFTGNAFHPVYDYPEHLKSLHCKIQKIRHFKLFNTNLYWSILARKG